MGTRRAVGSLLVHTHEVVGGDGTRARALRVFCPPRARTVDLETCRTCPDLVTLPESPDARDACITCKHQLPAARTAASLGAPDSFAVVAAHATVGGTMGPHVVCVRPEVAVETLADQFQAARAILLPVVDASDRFLGVLWRTDLAPPMVRENTALRLRLRGEGTATVGEEMDPRAISVREDSPLTEALHAITSTRARTVTVVAPDGTVVGLLSDLEILIWFALQRRRTRP